MAKRPEDFTPKDQEYFRQHPWTITDYDSSGYRYDFDGEDTLPGLDTFELLQNGEPLPENGILVRAHANKGYAAAVHFFNYRSLRKTRLQDDRPEYATLVLKTVFDHDYGIYISYENPQSLMQ